MTTAEKQKIREMQVVLQKINNNEKVFFNIALYERLGLVISKKKWGVNAVGNKVVIGHTFHLTEKAKSYLNITI